jgi:uncharacterized protein
MPCPPEQWDHWAAATDRALLPDVPGADQWAAEQAAAPYAERPVARWARTAAAPPWTGQRWRASADRLAARLRADPDGRQWEDPAFLRPPAPYVEHGRSYELAPWHYGVEGQEPDRLRRAVYGFQWRLSGWAAFPTFIDAVRAAAVDVFGLDPALAVPASVPERQCPPHIDPAVLARTLAQYRQLVANLYSRHYRGLRAYVRALYAETQADLAARGVEALLLWRGQGAGTGRGVGRVPVAGPAITVLSADYEVGRAYAVGPAGRPCQVLSLLVPRARVLATFWTGALYAHVRECYVLGGVPGDQGWCLQWADPADPEAAADEAQVRAWIAQATAEGRALHFPADLPPVAPYPHVGHGVLDAYEPDPAWWAAMPWGQHGVTHATRVLVWAEQAARHLQAQGVALDPVVVRWAAILHDCRRQHEGQDPGHGRRGAAWVLTHRDVLGVTEAQARAIAWCIAWHVPDDKHCPHVTAELLCLKDGDSLDRFRFRVQAFDKRYVRIPAMQNWRVSAAALDLAESTARARGPAAWGYTRACAQRLGLWPATEAEGPAAIAQTERLVRRSWEVSGWV